MKKPKKPKCSQCGTKCDELYDAEGCLCYDGDEGMCKPCACGEIEIRMEDLQYAIDVLQKRKDRMEA